MPRSFAPPAPPATPSDPWDGLLLVDKPAGPTSHDVVHRVRKQFRIRKVGHGGTLDPGATGLLVLLLGRGTRLSDRVMGGDKAYEGTLRLGETTDSQDADGTVETVRDPSRVTREDLQRAMEDLTGDIFQVPPMVSAVKRQGVPLYKLARKGQVVERKPRLVHIYNFKLTGWRPPEADFKVRCTKGVYVRTLCHEAGDALQCGAHLRSLRRTASGSFSVADALPLAALLDMTPHELQTRVLPCYRYLSSA